ncbi:MAG: hypothetical protein ACK55Z_00560, partial [bacterium]
MFANIPSLNTPTVSTAVSGKTQELTFTQTTGTPKSIWTYPSTAVAGKTQEMTSTQTAGTPKSIWTYPQLIPTEPRAVDQPFPPAVKGSYNYP